MDFVHQQRRRYAAEIMGSGAAQNARVEEAFATVARESYLTAPPWWIFSPGGLFEATTSDPAELYRDVLVVLDPKKGINNGQPSLHAAWIAAVDPKPGETVIHIGIGAGYYTAVLARLVKPGGAVLAFEIDPTLADLARRNLSRLAHVTVQAKSGVAAALPPADIVYVNAGATAPDPAWLRALTPGGRLIFPWQPGASSGVALLVTRIPGGFRAEPSMGVAFIACVGANGRPASSSGMKPDRVGKTRSVWLTAERPPDCSATAVYDDVWFSSDNIGER